MRELRLLIAVAVVLAASALAAAPAAAQGRVVIDTETKAKKGLYPIAVPMPVASDAATAKLITEVQRFDLGVSSWFKILDDKSFLANLGQEGLSIEPQKWKDVGAFGVIKARATSSGGKVTLEFKLYEVDKGAVPVLEKTYTGPASDARKLTHQWCGEVVKYFTGEGSFFTSQIVFAQKRGRGSASVVAMDFDGHGPRTLTKNDSINILPALSRSGGQVAFTSYMRGNADLYVTSAGGGGRAKRISSQPGMNTGAAWSPDGATLAVTLSKDGNPEIYLIDASSGAIRKRLTQNRYIDTSPAWSPDGKEIAFVSNREGGPQIFVMNADGSNVRRVSTTSGFNQTPAWSPRPGARQLAYTIRDDATGRFDIVVQDLGSGQLVRVTQRQGDNEEPSWAPGGRVLVFSSTRPGGSGLYLGNADGTGDHVLIFRGAATSPDFGP